MTKNDSKIEKFEPQNQRAALVFRLSSLGDVVLSLSVLDSQTLANRPVDWVVSKEFAPLLEKDPRVNKVFAFDRNRGFLEWVRFVNDIMVDGQYSEVFDLHRSLRTQIAKWIFRVQKVFKATTIERWNVISKNRYRNWLFYIFKKYTPQGLRPKQKIQSYLEVVGGGGHERPRMHIHWKLPQGFDKKDYWALMPSSAWVGKEWPVENYIRIIQNTGMFPVVLGTLNDDRSVALVRLLQSEAIPHVSGVGKWSLSEAFAVIYGANGYLGVDTGMAHASEALGKPAIIVYGPTHPDMGFGPWQSKSAAIYGQIGCQPCGKDGRYCIRFDKYRCMKKLKPDIVVERILSANSDL